MNELPLSKFAPFDKHEAAFQWEVSNKLKELNVNCKNCIYAKTFKKQNGLELSDPTPKEIVDNHLFNCSILYNTDNLVDEHSLCKFFTNIEEIEDDTEEKKVENTPDQEMSLAIQKLDFANSDIYTKIKDLRNTIINE
jgi:hypothetical protein